MYKKYTKSIRTMLKLREKKIEQCPGSGTLTGRGVSDARNIPFLNQGGRCTGVYMGKKSLSYTHVQSPSYEVCNIAIKCKKAFKPRNSSSAARYALSITQ